MSTGRRLASGITARLRGTTTGSQTGGVRGAIDRAHNGLVTGWLVCDDCGEDTAPTLVLEVDGRRVDADVQNMPRPELAHGTGTILRFAPLVGTATPRVRLRCATHAHSRIDHEPQHWQVPALASFENSRWPVLSGWIAVLDAAGSRPTLHWGDDRSAPLIADVARPDVRTYLGQQGVSGFHVNSATLQGFALSEQTPISIRIGSQVLASTRLRDSPVDSAQGCLPEVEPSSLPESVPVSLSTRLRAHPTQVSGESWQQALTDLGMDAEADPVSGQLGRYFTQRGDDAQTIAGQISERMSESIGVPHASLVPRTLVADQASDQDSDGVGSEPTSGETKVCVAGLYRHKSGLGQNAVRSQQALRSAGIHVCTESFFPEVGGWNPRLAAHPASVRALQDHAVLLHVPIDRTLSTLAAQPAVMAGHRLVAYFMWEVSVVPSWFVRALDVVDEIWTATEFVAQAFRAVTGTPVTVVGHAVEVGEIEKLSRHELGVGEDDFLVHFSFDANSTVARKNPVAVIDAFQQAFGGDPSARLAIKVRNMQQAQYLAIQGDRHAREFLRRLGDDESIIVISDEWSYSRTLGLIEAADCYLSLHRSEGFGYALAEAMLLGTPVIATGYSGNTEFMDPPDLVDFELVDLEPGDYFYWEPGMQWAQANTTSAAAALQSVRAGRGSADTAGIIDIDGLGRRYVQALGT